MSKRRRKKRPNLPDDVLARARQQAGIEDSEVDDEDEIENEVEDDEPEEQEVRDKPAKPAPTSGRVARRRKLSPAQVERSKRRGELDHDVVRELLAHPTKFVTEEELRAEYQHVLYDLRNMGLLAAALMVLLVVLAQFI